HDLAAGGVEPDHVERFAASNPEAAALPDGVAQDAAVAAKHAARKVDDVARRGGSGAKPLDEVGVMARGHEADVLAVGLFRNGEAEFACQRPGLGLAEATEREAQP